MMLPLAPFSREFGMMARSWSVIGALAWVWASCATVDGSGLVDTPIVGDSLTYLDGT